MPLPNAKPDRRIYELLKNVDLENLTFADLQSVGKTIFAEQGAEDELRRLVLVNLARMSVAGEWNGLTSAGGSNEFDLKLPGTDTNGGTNSVYIISRLPGWGSTSTSSLSLNLDKDPRFWPFISPKTGNITCGIDVTADGTGVIDIAIYSDNNGVPYEKIGGNFQYTGGTGGTGYEELTAASPVALTRGTQYWIAAVESTLGNTSVRGESNTNYVAAPRADPPSNLSSVNLNGVKLENSDNTLPAGPITATDFMSNTNGSIRWAATFS